jgi:hypothetical protein
MNFTQFLQAIGLLPRDAKESEKKSVLKKLTPEQFLLVKEEYKKFHDICEKEYEDTDKWHRNYVKRTNEECPKCQSKNVNDRIQRLQGEFSGSMSGSRSLFSGSLSGSSRGTIDTNEVNKCNDCQHEWKKEKDTYTSVTDKEKSHYSDLRWLLNDYKTAMEAEIDKNDLAEVFNTNEEKREAALNKLLTGYRFKEVKKFFGEYTIEAIYEIAKTVYKSNTYEWELNYFKDAWNLSFIETYLEFKHIA